MNENNENIHDTLLDELEKLTQNLINVDSMANLSTSASNTSGNLQNSTQNSTQFPSISTVPLTNENLSDFIYEKSQNLINLCMDTLEHTRTNLRTTLDAEEIEAFAGLIKATTAALDTLNDINIEKQKIKAAKKIKKLDIASKKQLAENNGKTTNILVAGREEIMKMIAENHKKITSIPIDADFEEKS